MQNVKICNGIIHWIHAMCILNFCSLLMLCPLLLSDSSTNLSDMVAAGSNSLLYQTTDIALPGGPSTEANWLNASRYNATLLALQRTSPTDEYFRYAGIIMFVYVFK